LDHKDHDFTFLEELAPDQTQRMKTMLGEVERRSESMPAGLTHIAECQQEIAKQKAAAEVKINAAFAAAFDTLRARQLEALESVQTLVYEKQRILEKQVAAIAIFQQSLSSSTSFVRLTLDTGSDAEVLLSKPILTQRLQELKEQECVVEPATAAVLYVHKNMSALEAAIANFCVTESTHADARCCIAEGGGLYEMQQVGELSEFVVTLRDSKGELTKCYGDVASLVHVDAVMVQLSGKDATPGEQGARGSIGNWVWREVLVQVASGRSPVRRCSYTSVYEGKLSISVRVCGRHIPGSPFEVETSPKPPFCRYGFTHVGRGVRNPVGKNSNCRGGKRVYNGSREGQHFAVATPGMANGFFFWDVKMHAVQNNDWILIGVIANTAPSEQSSTDISSYGWSSSNQVWIGGKCCLGFGGWQGKQLWRAGDEATVRLDCEGCTLSMKHRRLDRVFVITGLPAGKTWFIHAGLNGRGDSLEILPPSEEFDANQQHAAAERAARVGTGTVAVDSLPRQHVRSPQRLEQQQRRRSKDGRDTGRLSDEAPPKSRMTAPKRPMLAYHFYLLKENKERIRRDNLDATTSGVLRIAAEEWKGMCATQKKPFEELHMQDKKRYEQEMAKLELQESDASAVDGAVARSSAASVSAASVSAPCVAGSTAVKVFGAGALLVSLSGADEVVRKFGGDGEEPVL
jgi:hypothetical protein